MRFMASLAIPASRRVAPFLFHPCLNILVAGEAQVRTFGLEQIVEFCLMRVVAFRAFRVSYRHMIAFGLLKPVGQVRVAGCTDDALFIHEHPFDIAAVGVVARLTFPFRKGIVIGATRLIFHKVSMTLDTDFGSRGLEEILLVRSMGPMTRTAICIHDRLMRVGFSKLYFSIGVAAIADPVHPVPENVPDIRPMRVVA